MASTLHPRIESAIRTAKRWEQDKDLLAEIRASIPFKELVPDLVCETEAQWRSYLNSNAKDDAKKDVVGDTSTDDIKYKTSCFKDDDADWEGDDLLLKRLTLYFKLEVMTWCNQPPCSNPNCKGNEDGKQMESNGVRGPETEDEKTGDASRVEVYTCRLCKLQTTFPRFNSPRALFKSRRGRCGEFANLFGTYCRALGFDTRYLLDFTDHVWTEVWSVRQQRWIHADSCEGLVDRANMYEQGWGKKLNYAIGATHDSVADVTKRYTRKFYSDEFQARRREFATDENTSDRAFLQMDGALRQMNNIGKGRLEELEKRKKAEEKFFATVQSSMVWDVDYREGRISGSLAWKAARHELGDGKGGKKGDEGKDEDKETIESFFIESFYPSSRQNGVTIVVQPPSSSMLPLTSPKSHPECISVSGVPCATTLSSGGGGLSAVVVDETSGCILQSRAFSKWSSTATFLDTVPDGRVVAICCIRGEKQDGYKHDTSITNNLSRLGGLDIDAATASTDRFFLFAGQIGYHPKWTTSLTTSDSNQSIKVSLHLNISPPPKARLRSEINTVPANVTTRLPESVMPLKTQLVATNFQKRVAFNSYLEKDPQNTSVIGYTTRPDAPVYLMDNKSFPFQRAGGQTHNPTANDATSWVTYHFLPAQLVPDDNDVLEEATTSNSSNASPQFDVPIADDYFKGLLGNQLLVKNGSDPPTLTDAPTALANTRLVALYFSAQWCGPCRGFTPFLIEFYNYLKEVAPTHGLEIVFVSSDRDEPSFHQYYGKMPFAALPFSNRALAQQVKSVFGVRGIPSLVVIDSMSGQIVARSGSGSGLARLPPDESRRDVMQACQQGEDAIEQLFKNWLDKAPVESKSMLDILALSFLEAESDAKPGGEATNTKAENYLVRKKGAADGRQDDVTKPNGLSTEESADRVKELFSQLVAKGMQPNAAAAEAIKQTTAEQSKAQVPTKLKEGPLRGTSEIYAVELEKKSIEAMAEKTCQLNAGDKQRVVNLLSTANKYVVNVKKDPSSPRFRNFKLSNKIFDQITSTPGSIDLLTSLGFTVFNSDADFVASIPLSADLTVMGEVFDKLLHAYTVEEE